MTSSLLPVTFDDQIFTTQRQGGISRYFVELINAFRDPSLGVAARTTWRFTVNSHAVDARLARRPPWPVHDRGSVCRLLNRAARTSGGQVLQHLTFYDDRALASPARVKVATLYDMIPELYPEMFPSGSPHQAKQQVLEGVDLVLSISASAAADAKRFYSIAAPVVVTPLGVSSSFRPVEQAVPRLPERYVLFVGRRGGYKDFSVLVEAMASSGLRLDGLHLVAAGGGPLNESELALLHRWGLDARTHQVSLNDAELISAYSHASCFVFPSRYEGFGLPTLEAMACGCPTVLADTSAHPEVGGDAAVYFPAGDPAGLADRLQAIVNDPAATADLRSRGLARAAAMSWRRTASSTADAYRTATTTT